jgi:hypothetical protein
LVGGIPMIESVQSEKDREIAEEQLEIQKEGIDNQKPVSQEKSKESKNNTNKSPGRPNGSNQIPLQAAGLYGKDNIQSIIYKVEDLQSYACDSFKKNHKLQQVSPQHQDMLNTLCESVVCAKEMGQWKRSVLSCLKNLNNIDKLSTMSEVLEIAATHELTDYPSAILYHSKNIKK